MPVFTALLRAVNVGGTGKLPMAELRALCEAAGFENVRTYIQSGNVVFTSKLSRAKVQEKLERALHKAMGRPVRVHLRTPAELEDVLERNPFKKAVPNRVLVFFLGSTAPGGALETLDIPGREEVKASGREIFVHYPDGMGRSKLKVPLADVGTGRNLNTVRKLVELAREISPRS